MTKLTNIIKNSARRCFFFSALAICASNFGCSTVNYFKEIPKEVWPAIKELPRGFSDAFIGDLSYLYSDRPKDLEIHYVLRHEKSNSETNSFGNNNRYLGK